jgi:hypothetical protein
MQSVRIYTGDDGQSHFEELDLAFDPSQGAQNSRIPAALGAEFVYQPPGFVIDWHPAPRRQYVITLQGQAEIVLGDGTAKRFGPGDILLSEDVTGYGHFTRIVGEEARVSVRISLPG